MTPSGDNGGSEARTNVGPESKTTLKVVAWLCGGLLAGVSTLLWQAFSFREQTGQQVEEKLEKYVSKEVFTLEMRNLRDLNSARFDTIERTLSELRAAADRARGEPDRR